MKQQKEIKELINQIDNYLDKSLIYVRKKLVSLLSFDCDSKGANEYKNNILFTEEKIKRGNTNQELIDKISNQLTKEMNFAIPDLVKEAMKNINI